MFRLHPDIKNITLTTLIKQNIQLQFVQHFSQDMNLANNVKINFTLEAVQTVLHLKTFSE